MITEASHTESVPKATPARIVSVDALRGFDMFWIIGAGTLVRGLEPFTESPVVNVLSQHLQHVPWEGFHFYDLIFPLFVFLAGMSAVFSLGRLVEKKGKTAAHVRLVRRAVLLYLLGLLYYGSFSRDGGEDMFRYVGVLQRIAICYLAAGILFLNLRLRGMLATCVLVLLGYWAVMALVPVPGVGAGNYEQGKNLANYIDAHYLPGYKWDGDWDPEGLLSSLPAVATALLGVFAGMLLTNAHFGKGRRVFALLVAGAACLCLGWAWGYPFPIIKKLWTSSFVLWAGGWSYLLLASFYLVIDVVGFSIWARPFVWIGMNSITIYMVTHLVPFGGLIRRVLHDSMLDRLGFYADLTVALLALSLAVGLCYWLYRKRIFLRV